MLAFVGHNSVTVRGRNNNIATKHAPAPTPDVDLDLGSAGVYVKLSTEGH